jgi:hypothetical protein
MRTFAPERLDASLLLIKRLSLTPAAYIQRMRKVKGMSLVSDSNPSVIATPGEVSSFLL